MDWKQEHPQYDSNTLSDEDLPLTPWELWELWQQEAKHTLQYTNEIALATADKNGNVSNRMILLKYSDPAKGFCWYTNRESEKGNQLIENPKAEILWYNHKQQRQVRIRGSVKELSREDVEDYAHSRPVKSQISALISLQSKPVVSKKVLTEQFEANCKLYETSKETIPVAQTWTGFSLYPNRFEFWQGNTNRLHDRIIYLVANDNNDALNMSNIKWTLRRLYP